MRVWVVLETLALSTVILSEGTCGQGLASCVFVVYRKKPLDSCGSPTWSQISNSFKNWLGLETLMTDKCMIHKVSVPRSLLLGKMKEINGGVADRSLKMIK